MKGGGKGGRKERDEGRRESKGKWDNSNQYEDNSDKYYAPLT